MSKIYRYIVVAVVTCVTLFLVWYFSNIVAYILIAAVLAIIGKPVTDFLTGIHVTIKKKRVAIPKVLAALITLLGQWLVVIALFWIFVPIIFQKFNELSGLNVNQLIHSFQQPLTQVDRFIEHTFSIDPGEFSLVSTISNQVTSLFNINTFNTLFASAFSLLGTLVVAAFAISFITFFFLKEDRLFYNMIITLFPKQYEDHISRAMDSITVLLVRYFTGIVTESGIMTLIVSVGLLILGLPVQDALVIGFFVGIFNVIPYLGPIISICFGLFIGLVGLPPDIEVAGMVFRIAGTILFAQGIDNFIMQPVLYSNRVKAHPLETFLVILSAGSMAGILGMLLAIPSYTVLRVFAKEFFNNFRVVQKLTEKI